MIKTLTERQKEIVEYDGNTLVIANPGTGKTTILAAKYLKLVQSGVPPSRILCLTFTRKAMNEMEERIISEIRELKIRVNYAEMNIHTFHSFAMKHLEIEKIVSGNLLRYVIFKYYKDNAIFSYGDEYIQDTIVPKTEESIRYLKAFGITPDQVDEEALVSSIGAHRNFNREEMQAFSRGFLGAYREYERVKGKDSDYSDLLMRFLELKERPTYEYVLVDELQDVNRLEARIAMESGGTIFAVGDRKQAIFGFQGGSVGNFDMFGTSRKFTMEENFRSTDQILRYARSHYSTRTERKDHLDELAGLRSATGMEGPKTVICAFSEGSTDDAVREILRKIPDDVGSIAVLSRTNGMIAELARSMERESGKIVSHSIGSGRAKREIIWFISALLTNDVEMIKKGLLGPFSPVPVSEAMTYLSGNGSRVSTESILDRFPSFRALREEASSFNKIGDILDRIVLPVSASRGREWFNTAVSLRSSFGESLDIIGEKSQENIYSFLMVSGESDEFPEPEGRLVLSTVHKAKGREFDAVIYLPSVRRKNKLFVDTMTGEILKQRGIDPMEELLEESLRIDFVAMTRAKKLLYIIPGEDPEEYLNDEAEMEEITPTRPEELDDYSRYIMAFSRFVAGDTEAASRVLNQKQKWAVALMEGHFSTIDRLSYSRLRDSACDYLRQIVLRLSDFAKSLETGKKIHAYAEKIAMGQDVLEAEEGYSEAVSNIKSIVRALPGYKCESVEFPMMIPLSDIIPGHNIMFKGIIDAVFTDGNKYFILDWKTDRDEAYASEHDVQLEAYRRIFSTVKGVDLSKISAGIAYIYLRGRVNQGVHQAKLHYLTKADKAFEKFNDKVEKLMKWKSDPESFLRDLLDEECDHEVCDAVRKQYLEESAHT